jgi:hypothetical protein
MTKGYVMLAQNSKDNYVEQACLCAMSIHATNKDAQISLITNDAVPPKYRELFDQIIEIPWTDQAAETDWKVNNRWKIYHASPYDQTMVLDTDMLILQDLSSWWSFLENYKLYFVSNVYDYRGNLVKSDFYRKAFTANSLPNLYSGIHYFEKSELAHEFYQWLELVMNNWELFYGTYAKEHYPSRASIDVSAAVVAKILDCDSEITNSIAKYPTFTHMKPNVQRWYKPTERWQDRVGVYLTPDLTLKIGNHLQSGVFHYTEKDFVNKNILETYEAYLGIKHG